MYVVTNRVLTKRKGLAKLGKTPNPEGPNELRLLKIEKSGRSWSVTEMADKLDRREVLRLKRKYKLKIDENRTHYASLKVACEIFDDALKKKKSLLFYIHGYNNDPRDIVDTAKKLEDLYNVIVVPFTWPANGGGKVSGTAAYLKDKSDARASVGAFDRYIEKIRSLHSLLVEPMREEIFEQVLDKHPHNPEAAQALFSKLCDERCPVKLSLLCHSMGNYVLKKTLSTSENSLKELIFDNISLVAADTNKENHASWVEKLDVNNKLYIFINENDFALKWSRRKPGKEQKERLGHSSNGLNAANAVYVNLTKARHVETDHAYFKGDATDKNPRLLEVFGKVFNGEPIEEQLEYNPRTNFNTVIDSE